MLSTEDYLFIRDSAKRDLIQIEQEINNVVEYITRYSEQLCELKKAERKLESIVSKIQVCNECRENEGAH